jgi:predicted Zn-dependent peptidase
MRRSLKMNEIKLFTSELLGEKYYKIEHQSGLNIYVWPKNMSTTYGIFSVNFGGSVTQYGLCGESFSLPQGCAHFLEHKLFDNPDGKNADDVFSALGAYVNAYTSNDKTAYLFSAADNVYECLEHLIYFVTNPYFTKETVNKEIGIIAEEIRGCIDDPYDRCYLNMLGGMYFQDPVKNEICGSEKSISRITPEILYRCCEHFYTPANMTLSVCGNITPEEVVDIVDATLTRSRTPIPSVKPFCEPREVREAYIQKKMQVGKPLFAIGIKDTDIPTDSKERYKKTEAVNMLLRIMFSESGDFYMNMLEKGLVSPGFDVGYSCNSRTAFVMMSGESDDPVKLLDQVKAYVANTLARGIDRRDFEREKKCLYASYLSDFDSTEDIAFAMNSSASEGIDIFTYTDMLDSIDFDYVSDLVNKIFVDECITLSVIYPQE